MVKTKCPITNAEELRIAKYGIRYRSKRPRRPQPPAPKPVTPSV